MKYINYNSNIEKNTFTLKKYAGNIHEKAKNEIDMTLK